MSNEKKATPESLIRHLKELIITAQYVIPKAFLGTKKDSKVSIFATSTIWGI